MSDSEIHVRGSLLRSRMLWVTEQGRGALNQVLSALPDRIRALVDLGVDAKGWYSFQDWVELCLTIDRELGTGDLQLCYELGRYSAEVNLKGLYRLVFRIMKIGFLVRRSAAAWDVSYDAGKMVVVASTRRSVTLRIVDFPEPHRVHCLAVKGFVARAAEMTGEQVSEQYERCRADGDDVCEMAFRW